jgi:uncharacterized BrkB/YihY/UPF0761 family membrane protein
MPNTRVKFFNALIAALVAGTALQVFQFLYLSGQIWITKYNAIYGTFAAIPLLLLWIQLSWFIIFSAWNCRLRLKMWENLISIRKRAISVVDIAISSLY